MEQLAKALLLGTLSGFLNAALYVVWLSNGNAEIHFILYMSFVGSGVVLVALLLWGIPAHLILKKYKLSEFKWYALCGVIPSVLIPIDHILGGHYESVFWSTVFLAYLGAVAGLCFRASIGAKHA